MSQKVSRKSAVTEDKEKRQTQSPVKEMKKKMAANAEKEKQAAEKSSDKHTEKTVEKPTEKVVDKVVEKTAEKAEKHDKNEKAEKHDKNEKAEKHDKNEKPDKGDKKAEKVDKGADKKSEKQTKEEQKKPEPEKSKAESSKEDKSAKPEKPDTKKAEPTKAKQNGRERAHNGVSDVTLGSNGTDDVNGTVSADSDDDDVMLVIDDNDQDDLYPELTYEDTSDGDCFELPTPENGPSRSFTRRSQPKDKVLKLKEDATTATDRRLRSSNSPKPQEGKKPETTKKDKLLDSPKKSEGLEKVEEKDEEAARSDNKEGDVEVEVVLEVPSNDGEEAQDKERSKTDTNFSKSRVKVSPYRRSMRIADQTNTSLQANYTGNNTTMEMDITESSFTEDTPLDDSSYLRGLRTIRGRSSYKPLKEMNIRHVVNRSVRSTASTSLTSPPACDAHSRPTGTVVGRKRKPEDAALCELGAEPASLAPAAGKRMRVLERLAQPFRRVAAAAAMPTVARRNAEIVGINTDLPLTAPVASGDTFDPESLKRAPLPPPPLAPLAPLAPPAEPVAVPLASDDRDNKRCLAIRASYIAKECYKSYVSCLIDEFEKQARRTDRSRRGLDWAEYRKNIRKL